MASVLKKLQKATLPLPFKVYSRTDHEGPDTYLYPFFNLGARQVWVVNTTHRPLYPGKGDAVHIVQKARRAPGPVSTGAENFTPTGIRSLERPGRTESLYRLRYRDPTFNLVLWSGEHKDSATVLVSNLVL